MKAIKYVLVTILLCASATAFAQTLGTTPTVVTPEQKAAVKELLAAMDFKKMMSKMAGAMAHSMPQIVEQRFAASDTSLTAEKNAEARRLAAKSSETMTKSMIDLYNDPQIVQGMEDIMARAYSSDFAVDEIKAMTTFYSSPAGEKMLATQPQIMEQSMPEIMALIKPRMKEVMAKMATDIAEQAKQQDATSATPANK
jgi:hypothetical protein